MDAQIEPRTTDASNLGGAPIMRDGAVPKNATQRGSVAF